MTIALLQDKRIVLGVTGSIACYKAVDLASKLTQAGARLDAILTESAQRFVTPLSFRSVTGRSVYTDMWDLEDQVRHVKLGEAADLLVIAPATAHTMAKLAQGLADNLLTMTALAARCPVLVAPAMDGAMYDHPATQANIAILQERGVIFAGPAEGRMASGLMGVGRLLEPAELLGYIRLALGRQGPLHGRRVVVSAGPTREAIDPVRFLSNRSSGKQGLALAQAALDAGATVTLITGPVAGPMPVGVRHVPALSAEEMCQAALAAAAEADVLMMTAAVADFRPESQAAQKVKKTEGGSRVIRLTANPDVLMAVKEQREQTGKPTVTVGFAAESEKVLEYGREKLARKGLDFIAVNDISRSDAGFEVETNRVTLLGRDGYEVEMPLQSKAAVAEMIIQEVAQKLDEIDPR